MKLLFRIRTSLNEFYFEKLIVSSGGTLENHSRTTRVRPAATLPCVFSFSHETFYVLLFVIIIFIIYDLGPWGHWFLGFVVGETARWQLSLPPSNNIEYPSNNAEYHRI
jgi:hypothetical protein